jgi:ATP-dependent Lon protease
LAEIPNNVKKGLEIIPVSTVDEALKKALSSVPEPIEWEEDEDADNVPTEKSHDTRDGITAH